MVRAGGEEKSKILKSKLIFFQEEHLNFAFWGTEKEEKLPFLYSKVQKQQFFKEQMEKNSI